jgi:hypothetical protein
MLSLPKGSKDAETEATGAEPPKGSDEAMEAEAGAGAGLLNASKEVGVLVEANASKPPVAGVPVGAELKDLLGVSKRSLAGAENAGEDPCAGSSKALNDADGGLDFTGVTFARAGVEDDENMSVAGEGFDADPVFRLAPDDEASKDEEGFPNGSDPKGSAAAALFGVLENGSAELSKASQSFEAPFAGFELLGDWKSPRFPALPELMRTSTFFVPEEFALPRPPSLALR